MHTVFPTFVDTLKEQSIRDLDRVMEVVAEEHRKEMRQKMKMKEQIEEGERERAHRQRAAEKNRQKKGSNFLSFRETYHTPGKGLYQYFNIDQYSNLNFTVIIKCIN